MVTASSGAQPSRREARRAREALDAQEARGTANEPRRGGSTQVDPAPDRRDDPAVRLVVDPVACDGIGMCAHLAPGVIGLDSWGFPIAPRGPLPARDLRLARAAVSGCPRHALHLDEGPRT